MALSLQEIGSKDQRLLTLLLLSRKRLFRDHRSGPDGTGENQGIRAKTLSLL